MARVFASSSSLSRLAAVLGAFALSGCIGNSAFDDLNAMQPVGSAFNEAQFKDYSYLARSFGTQSSPAGQAFDAEGAISLTGTDTTIEGLANAYAQKALSAGRAEDVLPEAAPDGDPDAENVRLELLRDLDDGRDKAPEDAARAQADYDCWIMNRRVPGLAAASQSCRRSVTASLAKLERDLNPAAPSTPSAPETAPAPAPTVTAPPAPAAATAEFTVSFGFRSAKLEPEQLSVVAQAIAAARNGRQSRISVVGHSDSAEDSKPLSLKRAQAVDAALVELGARAEAITVSGVGKADPAVQTDDGVKEPKNRRVVITLVP